MTAKVTQVGVREFREDLARYLESETPLAITRHGRTVGYYIPAHPQPAAEEIEALKLAAGHLEELLTMHGVSVDEVVSEFRARRKDHRS